LLDGRTCIARDGVVDIALAGIVAAARYVMPAPMRCLIPRVAMRCAGDAAAAAVSELVWGEAFDLFETAAQWGFGRRAADQYTGWVPLSALAAAQGPAPCHVVTARLAPLFAAADIKAAVLAELPFGARLAGTPGERFLRLADGGFVHNRHIEAGPITPIEAARRFAGAPYLWGGRTPLGVDCSGLVQAALAACGIAVPRDTDQQLAAIGSAVAFEQRQAGDFVYFPGHVGILTSRDQLFHANAHWMATVEEPLADVIDRLDTGGAGAPVSGVRRIMPISVA
jgi:hypothetical protein